MKLHSRTPLVLHRELSSPEQRIWLKLENLQPCGSYKLRGIGALCQHAHLEGKRRLIAPSGGNAGVAAAYAGRELGMGVEVIVPTTTPEATRARIRALGADVLVFGDAWDQSNALALERAGEMNAQYIPAFDHPIIWEGHSTLIDEIVDELPTVDAVVASVGGGGLISGVMLGLERYRRSDCRVIAVETEGAASFHAALAAGHPVDIGRITSIAKSLGALQVAAWPVTAIEAFPYRSLVLSDAEAIAGTIRYADEARQLVEPACGVSLAVAYQHHVCLDGARDVVVVVCGGVSISATQIAAWKAEQIGAGIRWAA
ncbi:pyridoxal-phosphate dependent enzyme [Pararobbsia silviterrae]|uniref:L-serine ammonia-lyase n=1 Tax=Pararobbsia silviterrae TaxID=1792498 RepID=A0A494XRX1_9BURK|nr:pyridoxal-phosphate dependent enzyme [Pararobbsia silviterrae]RKP53378.1 pyridoxal-phosphate dependent enzyme [Pararobbsia silviterrae]